MSQSHKVGANCRLTKRLMRESWKVRYPQGFEKLHQLPGDLEGYAGAQGCVRAQEGPGSHVWPRISRKRRLRQSCHLPDVWAHAPIDVQSRWQTLEDSSLEISLQSVTDQ